MEVCKRVWALHKLVRAYAVPPEMVRFARGEAVSAKYCKSECMATDDEATGVVDDAQVCDWVACVSFMNCTAGFRACGGVHADAGVRAGRCGGEVRSAVGEEVGWPPVPHLDGMILNDMIDMMELGAAKCCSRQF